MSDNKAETGPQDRTRVNTSEDYEVRYWTQKFGCSKEQLLQAVQSVGPGAAAVEQHLRSRS